MTTNPYINKQSIQEQNLVEDLVIESIKINGYDISYLPRTLIKHDQIFEEDVLSVFNQAYTLEMYMMDFNGYTGQGDLLSKFGYEVRDNLTLVCSKRRYEEEIGNYLQFKRPMEGDIIYFPISDDFFEVKYVKNFSPFFALGKNYIYELKCMKLEYAHERINTGIPDIDSISSYSLANTGDIPLATERSIPLITSNGTLLTIGFPTTQDLTNDAQNNDFQEESDDIVNFTESNPFGKV